MVSPQSASVSSVQLMGADRAKRSIQRMAYQMAEDNGDKALVIILGINERGYVVAKQLAAALASIAKQKIEVLQLKIAEPAALATLSETLKAAKAYIVLVDDVIFSGKTMLQAITSTLEQVKGGVLRTAVLVDRGHRKVPVKATFVGLQWPTKLNEHVTVVTDSAAVKKVLIKDVKKYF